MRIYKKYGKIIIDGEGSEIIPKKMIKVEEEVCNDIILTNFNFNTSLLEDSFVFHSKESIIKKIENIHNDIISRFDLLDID